MVDESAYLIDRWKTEEGQAYYEKIQKEFYDHELLTQLASKYFGFIDEYIDLRGIDLHGRDLSLAAFAYCDISYGNFSSIFALEAHFDFSDIFDVNFDGAKLTACTFISANFRNSTFKNSLLSRTSFNNSKQFRCNFTSANIANTDMMLCNFEECIFRGIELDDVDLSYAKIPKGQKAWIITQEGKYNDGLKRIEWI